jgi:hypothetical protein
MTDLISPAHSGLAALSLVTTLGWLVVVAFGPIGLRRPLYIAAMASTGLVGLSGLATMVVGGWWPVVFPYVGLAAVAVHAAAGGIAKRDLAAGRRGAAVVAALVQVLTLIAAYGIMTVKPW